MTPPFEIPVTSEEEMPKQVRHDKDVILNSFQNLFLEFAFHLAFGFKKVCLEILASNPRPLSVRQHACHFESLDDTLG